MTASDNTIKAATAEQKDRNKFLSLSFLHFVNDLHSSVLPTIIPLLARSISLTLSQAGVLNSVFGAIHLFGQPILGFIADRQKKPYNAVVGPVLCAAGACFLPLAPNFLSAILLVVLLGIGTALFHPQGTGLCGRAAGSKNLAFFISIFAACGTFGSAIGPVYIVYIADTLGRGALPLAIIPVSLACLYVFRHFDAGEISREDVRTEKKQFSDFFREIRFIMSKIGGIVTIATIRDAANLGIRLFLPTLIVLQGGTLKQGGLMVFAVTLASTVSAIIGGRLADSIGYAKIVIGALSLSPLFLFAGLSTKGVTSVALIVLGFAFLVSSSSVTTAMSQELCPGSRSTVSSLSMGVSWGVANLFTSPVGYLADKIGLLTTMHLVALIPWTITLWYMYTLFKTKKRGSE